MNKIALFASEYLQKNNSPELHDTLVKVLQNTKNIRRGINIAAQDKFDTSLRTNPYYNGLMDAGITVEEMPVLAKFFDWAQERDEARIKEYLKTHKYAGRFMGVTPALKTWQIRRMAESLHEIDFI